MLGFDKHKGQGFYLYFSVPAGWQPQGAGFTRVWKSQSPRYSTDQWGFGVANDRCIKHNFVNDKKHFNFYKSQDTCEAVLKLSTWFLVVKSDVFLSSFQNSCQTRFPHVEKRSNVLSES